MIEAFLKEGDIGEASVLNPSLHFLIRGRTCFTESTG